MPSDDDDAPETCDDELHDDGCCVPTDADDVPEPDDEQWCDDAPETCDDELHDDSSTLLPDVLHD